jgi:hypothetical protein
MPTVSITTNQKVCLNSNFKDASGNYANVVTTPVWTNGNTSIISLTPSTDGFTALASGLGGTATGSVTVTVKATGASGATLTTTITVQVTQAYATQIIGTYTQPTSSTVTCGNLSM